MYCVTDVNLQIDRMGKFAKRDDHVFRIVVVVHFLQNFQGRPFKVEFKLEFEFEFDFEFYYTFKFKFKFKVVAHLYLKNRGIQKIK